MFHFPTFPPHALCVQARVTPHDWCGVPPFGNPRINARLTAPRGLSQPPTSFIGSWCPGIHRVPLTTWPHKHPRPSTTKKAQPPHAGTRPKPLVDQREYPDTYLQKSIDARVHCAVLKVRRVAPHPPPPDPDPTPQSPTDRYDRHEALQRSQPHPPLTRRPARSLRTQQRAYNQLPIHTTFHTPPKKSRTSGNDESPAELVSVPPLSSVTNTRAPPKMRTLHGPCTALDHHHEDGGQCSLERR
jgi:hypothetical protein